MARSKRGGRGGAHRRDRAGPGEASWCRDGAGDSGGELVGRRDSSRERDDYGEEEDVEEGKPWDRM